MIRLRLQETTGCNFCTRKRTTPINWIADSTDEHRHMAVILCRSCMDDLLVQVNKRQQNETEKGRKA